MTYTVFVASDVFGRKTNLELVFPSAPTLAELTKQTEAAFTHEQNSQRPGQHIPYQVSKFHVVDEVSDDWVEVVSANQLRNFCQLYSFQPHSTRYTESQGHIPPAKKGVMTYGTGLEPPVGMGSPYFHSPTQAHSPLARSPMQAGNLRSSYDAARGPSMGGVPSALPPGVHTLPDNVGHDDKVRLTFEEIDENKNRVLEQEEMARTFRLCELEFTTGTLTDLFEKADHDRDGVINWAEWQRFCELYPALLDSLYYRLKARWESLAETGRIDGFKNQRGAIEDRERHAQQMLDNLQRDLDDLLRRQGDADAAVAAAQDAQRAAEDQARDAARDAERARQAAADRDRDLKEEKERERQAQMRAAESQRELDDANRRAAMAQQGVEAAEAAERRARQALEEAMREKERQQGIADQAARDAQGARDRHAQILGDIPRSVEAAKQMLADAQRELADADRRQRELAAAANAAGGKVGETSRARDDLARQLQHLRDRQEPGQRELNDAKNALVDHDRMVTEMQDRLAEEDRRKRALLDKEKEIVEQEVRLREQRESLEKKESALRNAHVDFFHAAGRQSPGRSRSPNHYGTPTKY